MIQKIKIHATRPGAACEEDGTSPTGALDTPARRCWERQNPQQPLLMFSPLAWLKLKFFCHAGDTEVGGFAISSEGDPLYVEDFVSVRQRATFVNVEFDDDAVADYFDAAVDAGLPPARFARLWCHSHPGDSPEPSMTDEQTFARVFGSCDWSLMFILSRTGRTYARLAFCAGPGGSILLPVQVDWEAWPQVVLERAEELPALLDAWAAEFDANVQPVTPVLKMTESFSTSSGKDDPWSKLDELHELQALGEQSDEQFMRLCEAEQEMLQ